MSKKVICLIAIIYLSALAISPCCAEKINSGDGTVTVLFDAPLRGAAGEILKLYPAVRDELRKDLGWETEFKPEIVLVKDHRLFFTASGSDLVTAFAVPGKDRIVIDYSKMGRYPYTVDVTLKHEFCHLELHHHIASERLPRWFDEGICQWVTGGYGELIDGGSHEVLTQAVMSGRLLSIGRLTASFPSDGRDMLLAYEESRSIVDYLQRKFGVSAVRRILEQISRGEDLGQAVRMSLSVSLDDVEKKWRASLSPKSAWLYYLRDNLYEILFVFAAFLAVWGFLKVLKKKREYKDEDEGEDGEDLPEDGDK